ncbi:MAG: hypothetical protein JWR74_724 [Polaromonas sp.]|nr:hypothetical protein [Polaromonas sp.]
MGTRRRAVRELTAENILVRQQRRGSLVRNAAVAHALTA